MQQALCSTKPTGLLDTIPLIHRRLRRSTAGGLCAAASPRRGRVMPQEPILLAGTGPDLSRIDGEAQRGATWPCKVSGRQPVARPLWGGESETRAAGRRVPSGQRGACDGRRKCSADTRGGLRRGLLVRQGRDGDRDGTGHYSITVTVEPSGQDSRSCLTPSTAGFGRVRSRPARPADVQSVGPGGDRVRSAGSEGTRSCGSSNGS